MLRFYPAAILAVGLIAPAHAIVPERDFSGNWYLDAASSNTRALPMQPETSLLVAADDAAVRCTAATSGGANIRWSYLLDGTETRMRAGADTRSSIVKWEGAALLVNTQVTGSEDYTVMDRWKLSRDRSVLTITRQVERGGREIEGVLVYTKTPRTRRPPLRRLSRPNARRRLRLPRSRFRYPPLRGPRW